MLRPKLSMRHVFTVSLFLSGACGHAWAQSGPMEGVPGPTIGIAGASSSTLQQSLGSVGFARIPLGSTELGTPGESPVILPLGGTFTSGRGPAGASGIPLGSTEILNPSVTTAPQTASASGCTNMAGSTMSFTAGTLPPRLFDGRAGIASQSGASGLSNTVCTSSALSATQQGMATQRMSAETSGRTGIPQGAAELTSNGLSGVIAATPVSPASPLSEGN
jgi:hypothetical protein